MKDSSGAVLPGNAAEAEYIKTPRDTSHQTDVVATLGGPILRDRAWFFVGYAPQYYPSERTVTWATPGSNPATQTFDNADPNNIAWNYNVTTQIAQPLRGRFTGSNETQKGALGLPGIEPNGTSNSNANSSTHVRLSSPSSSRTPTAGCSTGSPTTRPTST